MDATRCFEAAVRACEGKLCPELECDLHEVPLHIIYALEQVINLSDVTSHPLAVSMLVDTFMSSHGNLAHSKLTFVSSGRSASTEGSLQRIPARGACPQLLAKAVQQV